MTMRDAIFPYSILLYVGRLIQIKYQIVQYNNSNMMFSIKCDKNVYSCYYVKG